MLSPALIPLILGLLLALSVAGNGWQYHEHGKDLIKIGTAEQFAADTMAAAKTCSDSVDNLAAKAATQHASVLASLRAQASQVAALKGATIAALNAQPADPADLCQSLEIYLSAQIKAERGVK